MTYEEMEKLAMENYNNGGDVFVECWDEREFDEYVEFYGPMTEVKALELFAMWKDEFADMMGW